MMTLDHHVSGFQLATALKSDPSGFCQMVEALAEDADAQFMQRVGVMASNHNADELILFLRKLATAIEANDLPLAA